MEEDEDCIVRQIPVYLSKQLADQLYLYQYPLRPSAMRYDSTTFKSCAIKPEHQQVKLETSLNVNSSNFDMSKAEEIALNADGETGYHKKEPEVIFENGIMDKQCFASSKSVDECNKYAIGVLHGGDLHITPLKGIVQLRPDFSYLDKSDKRQKERERCVSESEEAAAEEQAQQITVKFAQTESDRVRKAREKSFNYLSRKSAEEPWCQTEWHHPQSDVSELERMKLVAEDRNVVHLAEMEAKQYLRMLVPTDKEEAATVPPLPAHMISLNALKTLPLLEQCRLLLKDAKIISYQQLMLLLAGSEGLTAKTILRTLPQVAVVIRGNWVVRSDILYPKDTFSGVSGVPAHIMCRTRDYVLYLFTQRQYVDRRKVSAVIKLPAEETKEIFVGVARLRLGRGWELLLPPDNSFVDKHPDIAQRQALVWEQKQKQFAEFMGAGVGGPSGKSPRQRRKSKSVSEDANKDSAMSLNSDVGTERDKKHKSMKMDVGHAEPMQT